MEKSHKKSPLYIKTMDYQIVAIDKAIAQQSNLFTVLKDIYKGTTQQPLAAPVTKAEWDIFCTAIRQPASKFAATLNDEKYSSLMDIAEKLKAQLFYADLMEQVLPVNELINRFTQLFLNKAQLKKAVYQQCLKKKSITLYKDRPETKIIDLKFNNDGSYFTETIMPEHDYSTTNLWNTQEFKPIKQFTGIKDITFSPDNSFIITSNNRGLYSVYFISEDKTIKLNNQTILKISPQIHQNCNAILISDNLHTIDDQKNIRQRDIPAMSCENVIFHPSLPLIISNLSKLNSSEIIIRCLKTLDQLSVSASYEKRFGQKTNFCISSDGSLLLINKYILLNIQDPCNPIELKMLNQSFNIDPTPFISVRNPSGVCMNDKAKACFITQKNIIFSQLKNQTFFLFDKDGEKILSDNGFVQEIITDSTDNYIALLLENNKHSSIIKIFNSSNLKEDNNPLIINDLLLSKI